MTKDEIIARLDELGIKHDGVGAKVDLEALLPVEPAVPEVVPEKKSERQARWDAFLVAHEKQNPEKHAARVKEGLTMPENF